MGESGTRLRLWEGVLLSNVNNVAVLVLSLFLNLLLPLVMAKPAFADFKTVVLLTTYAGLLHLGLLDGLYLEVVGARLSQVSGRLVSDVRRLTLTIQVFAVILLVALVFVIKPLNVRAAILVPAILICAALNYGTLFAFLLQGTANFRTYTRVNVTSVLVTIIGAAALILSSAASYPAVTAVYGMGVFITLPAYEWWLFGARRRGMVRQAGPSVHMKTLLRRGAKLLGANLCVALVFSVDRLVVTSTYSKATFANYVFASGLAALLYVALDAIAFGITPFIRGSMRMSVRDERMLHWILALLMWAGAGVYWLAEEGVRAFYPQYVPALPLLRLFLASVPFAVLLRSTTVASVMSSGREADYAWFALFAAVAESTLVVASHLAFHRVLWIASTWSAGIVLLGAASAWHFPLGFGISPLRRGPAIVMASLASAAFLLASSTPPLVGSAIYLLVAGTVLAVAIRGESRNHPDGEGCGSGTRGRR